MTASTVEVQQARKSEILPFKVRKALVGMKMEGIDKKMLKYLKFFSTKIPVGAAFFLHVMPGPDLFNAFDEEGLPPTSEIEFDPEIMEKLKKKIARAFPEETKLRLSFNVREGNPLEELLNRAEEVKADLVVIGHSASDERHHGILVKNFARQVWSNALIIPDQAKCSLKRILVPVDFSVNSAEALHTAVAINKGLEKPVSITVLHVYDLPGNFSAYRFNQEKVLEMIREDRERALATFIKEHVPAGERKHISTALFERNHDSIGKNLTAFAEQKKHDLIVMGAKGHSKVALLLMGSVTEKVISLSEKIPVLVVK